MFVRSSRVPALRGPDRGPRRAVEDVGEDRSGASSALRLLDDDASRDDAPLNDSQEVLNDLSPGRAQSGRTASRSSGRAGSKGGRRRRMLDDTASAPLELNVRFNAGVIDALAEKCPTANLAGGNNPSAVLRGYAERVRAGSIRTTAPSTSGPVAQYVGFRERYDYGRSTREYGRLYSKGAQGLLGEVRRHLFDGLYEDVDIRNAQPAMLVQVMDRLHYGQAETLRDALELYVAERDEQLRQVCASVNASAAPESPLVTPKEAKELFISILFGGTVARWTAKYGALSTAPEHASVGQFVAAFAHQVGLFVAWFEHVYGPEVSTRDRRIDEESTDVAHRHLALYLQNEERIVMLSAISFIQVELGGEVGVLIHDGCLCALRGGASAGILARLSRHVHEHAGYRLDFAVKPLTPTVPLPELLASLASPERTSLPMPCYDPKLHQDGEFADHFLEVHASKILFDAEGKIYHFADATYDANPLLRGTWLKGFPPGAWWSALYPNTAYSQCARKMASMRTEIAQRYPQRKERLVWEQYPAHWVPLLDCLLDTITLETHAITPEHRLTRKIPLRHRTGVLSSPEHAACVRQLALDNARLYNSEPQLEAAVEERIAYACLTRGNPLKKVTNFVGNGDNGKSTIWMRPLAVLGNQFVQSLAAKQFCGRAQATAANPHLRAAIMANFAVVEEPAKDEMMSAAMLKEFSGNTPMLLRKLYENGDEAMPNNATFVFMSNHPFQVKDADQAWVNRIERIEMPCTFYKSAALREAALAAVEDPFARTDLAKRAFVGDKDFDERYRGEKMREVYFASLVEHYRNFVLRDRQLTDVPDRWSYAGCDATTIENDCMQDHYEDLFEETKEASDTLTTDDLVSAFDARNFKTNKIAVGRFMKGRTSAGAVSMIKKRGRMVYVGLRRKPSADMFTFGGYGVI